MKKNIILSIAAAMIALPLSAQDAAPPQEKASKCECGSEKEQKHHGRHGHHRPGMNPEKRGMFLLGRALVIEKYDKDKDGKLSEEEIVVIEEDMKKAHEARKQEMLKKFDKDGDGKLSKEERQGMKEEWKKAHPEIVQKMDERRAEMLKKFDKDGDGKLSREEKKARREASSDELRPKHRHGKGHHKGEKRDMKGPGHGAVAMAGMALLMEKYDADKDGVLSESESAAMKADAQKAAEARKEARKALRESMKKQNEENKEVSPEPENDDE